MEAIRTRSFKRIEEFESYEDFSISQGCFQVLLIFWSEDMRLFMHNGRNVMSIGMLSSVETGEKEGDMIGNVFFFLDNIASLILDGRNFVSPYFIKCGRMKKTICWHPYQQDR